MTSPPIFTALPSVEHNYASRSREENLLFERSHGSFHRRFELPFEVDADKIKARLENGTLEIRIPRSQAAQSRSKKISIS